MGIVEVKGLEDIQMEDPGGRWILWPGEGILTRHTDLGDIVMERECVSLPGNERRGPRARNGDLRSTRFKGEEKRCSSKTEGMAKRRGADQGVCGGAEGAQVGRRDSGKMPLKAKSGDLQGSRVASPWWP